MTNQPLNEPLPTEPAAPRHAKGKTAKKIVLICLLCLLGLVVAAVVTFFILRAVGRSQLSGGKTVASATAPGAIIEEDTVIYQGKRYRFNENVTAILCMGIDREKLEDRDIYGNNGQADALFLITMDLNTADLTITAIPRESMTDIDLYSKSGSYLGVQRKQLCVAYAYGDGRQTSCEAVVEATSRFLYGMPIQSYFAIDLSAIEKLNDSVGGVTVTCNEDYTLNGTRYKKGQKIYLKGYDARVYLQARNQETVDAGYLRMERQLDYLTEFSDTVFRKTAGNLSTPLKLFNLVSRESVTNLNANKITYLTSLLFDKRSDVSAKFRRIEGTQTVGADEHVEFDADEDALYQLILDLYYTPVETVS